MSIRNIEEDLLYTLQNEEAYSIECDGCGYLDDEVFDEWEEAKDYKQTELRREGWTTKCLDGMWFDLCPDCTEKMKKEEIESDFGFK